MKKICLMFNHLQLQDGVCRSAVAIANLLAKRNDVEITLIPLFKYDKKVLSFLSNKVKIKPAFRFYFKGLSWCIHKIPALLLYKLLVNNKYDINIAFQYGMSTKIIASGAHRSHVSIGWMHCFDEGLIMKKYYEKMDKMVCVSKCNAERLKLELGNIVDIDYNYNPIDDVSIREQGSKQISQQRPNCFLFVSVARMSIEKGYIALLNVIARLKKDGYTFQLWLIGDGPILGDLKEQSHNLKIDDIVTFFGQQSNPHAYVSQADVYICSSTIEGYSTSCTEAIMQGIPVLTTDCSGGEEIIKEAECGLLFGQDENSIYCAMKQVLETPSIVKKWKNTLVRTKVKFSCNRRFERFLNIINIK